MVARAGSAVRQLDDLLRVYQVGFVAVWPLLGLACVTGWNQPRVIALLAVSVAFNTFGSVLNDVIDLPFDTKHPSRSHQWLVRGTLKRRHALVLAVVQLPVMVAVHVVARLPLAALPMLSGAVLGQTIYDLYGKRCSVPPFAEMGQGAAAFLLVSYGAAVSGNPWNSSVWFTATAAMSFILLANAFHGGLRDIDGEIAYLRYTTPIWLGCRGLRGCAVHISTLMSLYSGINQACLILVSVLLATRFAPETERSTVLITAVVAASFLNAVFFFLLHRVKKPAWDALLRVHVTFLAIPLMLSFIPRLGGRASATLFLVYFAPSAAKVVRWISLAVTYFADSTGSAGHDRLPDGRLALPNRSSDKDFPLSTPTFVASYSNIADHPADSHKKVASSGSLDQGTMKIPVIAGR
jgi:4-hydroxybenzoate polyprenyltransferase